MGQGGTLARTPLSPGVLPTDSSEDRLALEEGAAGLLAELLPPDVAELVRLEDGARRLAEAGRPLVRPLLGRGLLLRFGALFFAGAGLRHVVELVVRGTDKELSRSIVTPGEARVLRAAARSYGLAFINARRSPSELGGDGDEGEG